MGERDMTALRRVKWVVEDRDLMGVGRVKTGQVLELPAEEAEALIASGRAVADCAPSKIPSQSARLGAGESESAGFGRGKAAGSGSREEETIEGES